MITILLAKRYKCYLLSLGDTEHSKADSISWHAIRLAVTRLCIGQMEDFLRVAGIEPQGKYFFKL